jgi:hypothetical protein
LLKRQVEQVAEEAWGDFEVCTFRRSGLYGLIGEGCRREG